VTYVRTATDSPTVNSDDRALPCESYSLLYLACVLIRDSRLLSAIFETCLRKAFRNSVGDGVDAISMKSQSAEISNAAGVLTQSALEIDEVAMNVKSCLKVNNGLLYRTVSLKLEGMRIIY
jgi:hypothetical protein